MSIAYNYWAFRFPAAMVQPIVSVKYGNHLVYHQARFQNIGCYKGLVRLSKANSMSALIANEPHDERNRQLHFGLKIIA
ncbi:hypothetical protein [Mucilaginibacter phyllosphaerae]